MWTMDDGIGLTWGMTGGIGPGALPQTHGMRICIVISDSWVWNRSRGLHPEIWPLLTPPLISHNPRGACRFPSLSGLVSALSCRMELAPIPGPCFLLCRNAHSPDFTWLLHLAIQASESPRPLPVLPAQPQEYQLRGDRVLVSLAHPCPPRSSVKKHFLNNE